MASTKHDAAVWHAASAILTVRERFAFGPARTRNHTREILDELSATLATVLRPYMDAPDAVRFLKACGVNTNTTTAGPRPWQARHSGLLPPAGTPEAKPKPALNPAARILQDDWVPPASIR